MKIVNKYAAPVTYELQVQGLPGARLTEADEGLGPANVLGLPVGADSVGTYRVLVTGQPDRIDDGSQPIDFTMRNPESGEQTVYHSLFMGPAGRSALSRKGFRCVTKMVSVPSETASRTRVPAGGSFPGGSPPRCCW